MSLDEYISARHVELATRIESKHKIYLDQKYWNYCRDALRGKPQRPAHERILSLLVELVASERAVCPVSFVVFQETMKQSDMESRRVTAELIDGLSAGCSLQPYWHNLGLEINHWLKTERREPLNVVPVEKYVWTYTSNVLGVRIPHIETFSHDANSDLGKYWFDVHSRIPFSKLIDGLPANRPQCTLITPEFYAWQNDMCSLHNCDFNTFEDAFLLELRGALESNERWIRDAWIPCYERETGNTLPARDSAVVHDMTSMVCNLIYSAFEHRHITTQMPSFRIPVGILAAIRHKRYMHRWGDIEDHMHASLALPYCDALFTERKLGNLLTRAPLGYDKMYNCVVLWEDSAIVEYLERLVRTSAEPSEVCE
jgi:hypothetical protein